MGSLTKVKQAYRKWWANKQKYADAPEPCPEELLFELLQERFISTRDDPWGTTFRIICHGYEPPLFQIDVTSAGPDRQWHTGDDLSTVGSAQAPKASLTTCPSASRLASELKQIWRSDVELKQCAPGSFPMPGIAVVAWTQSNDGHLLRRAVIVDGTVLAEANTGPMAEGPYDRTALEVPIRTADLDGDGVDEFMLQTTHDNSGIGASTLAAYKISTPRLLQVLDIPVGFDNTADVKEDSSNAIVCTADFKIGSPDSDGRRILTVGGHDIRGNGNASRFCAHGRTSYTMKSGQLSPTR